MNDSFYHFFRQDGLDYFEQEESVGSGLDVAEKLRVSYHPAAGLGKENLITLQTAVKRAAA